MCITSDCSPYYYFRSFSIQKYHRDYCLLIMFHYLTFLDLISISTRGLVILPVCQSSIYDYDENTSAAYPRCARLSHILDIMSTQERMISPSCACVSTLISTKGRNCPQPASRPARTTTLRMLWLVQ